MIARALILALRQMGDAETLRVVVKVIGLTLVIFVTFGAALWALLQQWILPTWLPAWFGPISGADGVDGTDGVLAAIIAIAMTFLSGWFLFRAVAMAVAGLFTDGIVASVEEDHYPAIAAAAVPIGMMAGLRLGLRSAMRAIGWNGLALPLYLVLLTTGVGTLALVLIINMLILGRDFEDMVRARHKHLAPLARRDRWALGLVSATLFVIPVVGLLAPLIGAAMAVHMLHARPVRA